MNSAREAALPGLFPFLGKSAALSDFLERLRRAAESEATVLFSGESGSGKSRAAQRLHLLSARREGPFVAASLVATSASLIDSTLFGHERGAFTDAHRNRTGLFRRASGGSLLLDSIDHLPLDSQVKLLRVLQERVVEPLGSEESLPVDVRVLATCSAPLERAVEEGRFREDLYYRLSVVPLEVPPLRRRKEDIEELATALVASSSARVGVAPRPLSETACERLRAHAWPGNVRELENALERVLVLASSSAEGTPLEAEDFAFLGQGRAEAVDDVARAALALGLTLDDLARAMMDRALKESRGNVSAAARAVGLTRRAFDYRMGHAESDGGN